MLHHVYCVLQIPVALATSQPERRVKPAIDRLNLANYFDAVVTAEDNGSPEVRRHVLRRIASLHRSALGSCNGASSRASCSAAAAWFGSSCFACFGSSLRSAWLGDVPRAGLE
jgi:hypothetical protein